MVGDKALQEILQPSALLTSTLCELKDKVALQAEYIEKLENADSKGHKILLVEIEELRMQLALSERLVENVQHEWKEKNDLHDAIQGTLQRQIDCQKAENAILKAEKKDLECRIGNLQLKFDEINWKTRVANENMRKMSEALQAAENGIFREPSPGHHRNTINSISRVSGKEVFNSSGAPEQNPDQTPVIPKQNLPENEVVLTPTTDSTSEIASAARKMSLLSSASKEFDAISKRYTNVPRTSDAKEIASGTKANETLPEQRMTESSVEEVRSFSPEASPVILKTSTTGVRKYHETTKSMRSSIFEFLKRTPGTHRTSGSKSTPLRLQSTALKENMFEPVIDSKQPDKYTKKSPSSLVTNSTSWEANWKQKSPSSLVSKSPSWEANVIRNIRSMMEHKRKLYGHTIENTQSLFRNMDKDRSGFLSSDEITSALHRLDIDLNPDQIVDLVKRMDKDHDGKISYDELVETLHGSHGKAFRGKFTREQLKFSTPRNRNR